MGFVFGALGDTWTHMWSLFNRLPICSEGFSTDRRNVLVMNGE